MATSRSSSGRVPLAVVRVGDDLFLRVDELAQSPGDAPRLFDAGCAGGALDACVVFVGRDRPEEFDGGFRRDLLAMGAEGLVLVVKCMAEECVDEIEDRRLAAEVFVERQLPAFGDFGAQVVKDLRAARRESGRSIA